jgi:uncharacterized membrane protein YciS (DUF1049 family)
MIKLFSYLFLAIIVVIGLSFAALNSMSITLHYYFGQSEMSLSLLIVYAIGLGVLIGFLMSFLPILKLKHKNRQLTSRLKKADKKLEGLSSNQ